MVADTVPQHIDLEQRKQMLPWGLVMLRPICCNTHTSYFCLVNSYCSSNFSASSWYIHSHSSLAFSLWHADMQKMNALIPVSGPFLICLVQTRTTSLHLLEFVLAHVIDVQVFASLVQDLLLLLALSLPLTAPLFCLQEDSNQTFLLFPPITSKPQVV